MKYYYVNDAKQVNLGLVKIDGDFYYVCYSGKIKTDANFNVTAEHVALYPELREGWFRLDAQGKLIFPKSGTAL